MLIILISLSLAAWLYLLLLHGYFWKPEHGWAAAPEDPGEWPAVTAVVPARNEAAVIEPALSSLRRQEYPGAFSIILVDDNSEDGTALLADGVAAGSGHPLHVFYGAAPRPGWTGKVWAMAQGVTHAGMVQPDTRYLWFTDADLVHDRTVLRTLVLQAEGAGLDLVSNMARLHCESGWERLLIPAFVFFFQKLYPFRLVNSRKHTIAAAAGGVMLVRARALDRSGGLQRIRGELIDDCALARLLKAGGPIRLQLTTSSRGIRPYGFADVWNMVSRSAYTQLKHSPLLLSLTIAGMIVLYLLPLAGLVQGSLTHDFLLGGISAAVWALMTLSYLPTVRLYGQSVWRASLLPMAAVFYTLMTFDSARRHWQGKGGWWKGRPQSRL